VIFGNLTSKLSVVMNKLLAIACVITGSISNLYSSDNDTVSIYVFVPAINELDIPGSATVELNLDSFDGDITNATTYYSLTTNVTSPATKKITISTDAAFEESNPNVTFQLTASAVLGSGTSTGAQNLKDANTSAKTLVSAIPKAVVEGSTSTTALSYYFKVLDNNAAITATPIAATLTLVDS